MHAIVRAEDLRIQVVVRRAKAAFFQKNTTRDLTVVSLSEDETLDGRARLNKASAYFTHGRETFSQEVKKLVN